MKYLFLFFALAYLSLQANNLQKHVYWMQLISIELKYKHALKLNGTLQEPTDPDYDIHHNAGVLIANDHAYRLAFDNWDKATMNMANTHLFNDDELAAALVTYKSRIFNLG